jgi:hypothetical protein
MDDSGNTGATLALDATNRASVTLINPHSGWPSAALEIDDKGAHVNNAGGSGTILIDASGKRRLNVTVTANGDAKIARLGDDGRPDGIYAT